MLVVVVVLGVWGVVLGVGVWVGVVVVVGVMVVVVVVVVVVEAQAGFVVSAAAAGDRCLWTHAATVPEGGVLL